jgi:hypothetical protein
VPREKLLRRKRASGLFVGFFAHLATGATLKFKSEGSEETLHPGKHPITSGFSFEYFNAFDLARRLPLEASPKQARVVVSMSPICNMPVIEL